MTDSRAEADPESFVYMVEVLGGVGLHQRVNLLIAPTPDLDILECTSHAGLRLLLR